MKNFFAVFVSIFLAEIADKTQIAVFSFSASAKNKFIVFLAASLALALSSLIAVLFGDFIYRAISPKVVKIFSGILFIVIGIATIFLKEF